jgi:hypothetical protein
MWLFGDRVQPYFSPVSVGLDWFSNSHLSLPTRNNEDVKVVQELLRHVNRPISYTLTA